MVEGFFSQLFLLSTTLSILVAQVLLYCYIFVILLLYCYIVSATSEDEDMQEEEE
jgi:Ca2+/Na+ antiporter